MQEMACQVEKGMCYGLQEEADGGFSLVCGGTRVLPRFTHHSMVARLFLMVAELGEISPCHLGDVWEDLQV